MSQDILLFASGDLRQSANEVCWPAQADLEARLARAVESFGRRLMRAHPVKPDLGHGFLASQREGMDAFADIAPDAPIIVAEAVWQYSHHVLGGLALHRGPILTVANWSGQWPGLVGLLNLNGSLTKAGVPYSSLWSETLEDDFFLGGLRSWLETGRIEHDTSHVHPFAIETVPDDDRALAAEIARDMRRQKVILGVFDEGCMGMFNAIIPDHLLLPMGVLKERLSQSTLYHATLQVSEAEGRQISDDVCARGLTFHLGEDPATELTEAQVIDQCRLYVAAVRLAHEFGCEAIGIQYQQGLKDLLPASDLVEGMLNDDTRPEVRDTSGAPIRPGRAIPHFNEVDECAGLDAVLIHRVHRALGQPVETTLHDLRWGEAFRVEEREEFVWVFEISGAAPPSHHEGGWAGSDSLRQPPMFFPSGGGTLRGVARPGPIVWSRIYVEDGALHMDIGRGEAIRLPDAETERRRNATTPEWPIMHGVLYGVSRDQMMARHKANHIQVVYASDGVAADRCLAVRSALATELGIAVHVCGDPPQVREARLSH